MRPIKTVYYRTGLDPQVNRSADANRAIATCVLHMQVNHYGARSAEVYDDETGELHAVIRRNISGTLTIIPKRDLQKFETKYALGHLIGLK